MSKNILILNEQGMATLAFDGVAYKLSDKEGYVIHRTKGTLTTDVRNCDLSVTLMGHPGSSREESLKHRLLFKRFAQGSAVAMFFIVIIGF